MPVSIKLKPSNSKHKISTSARKIIAIAERQLMQDRVRGINKVIEASNNNRDNNKTRLASLVTSTDLDRCGKFIDKVRDERHNRVKARHVRKFQILYSKSKQNHNNERNTNTNRSSQGVNANRQGLGNNSMDNNHSSEGIRYNNKWVINLSKTRLTE